MVGRKILKPLGDKICEGFVAEHKPAGGGREEMWVLRWELESEKDEEVARPVLDKRLNLKAVQEREFPSAVSRRFSPVVNCELPHCCHELPNCPMNAWQVCVSSLLS